MRAYSLAVKEGLKNSRILEKLPGRKLTFTVDYTAVGKLQYLAGKMGLVTLDCVYTDKVEMVLLAPEGQEEEVLKKVAEATGGTANAQCSDPIFYALDGKETILF